MVIFKMGLKTALKTYFGVNKSALSPVTVHSSCRSVTSFYLCFFGCIMSLLHVNLFCFINSLMCLNCLCKYSKHIFQGDYIKVLESFTRLSALINLLFIIMERTQLILVKTPTLTINNHF